MTTVKSAVQITVTEKEIIETIAQFSKFDTTEAEAFWQIFKERSQDLINRNLVLWAQEVGCSLRRQFKAHNDSGPPF